MAICAEYESVGLVEVDEEAFGAAVAGFAGNDKLGDRVAGDVGLLFPSDTGDTGSSSTASSSDSVLDGSASPTLRNSLSSPYMSGTRSISLPFYEAKLL